MAASQKNDLAITLYDPNMNLSFLTALNDKPIKSLNKNASQQICEIDTFELVRKGKMIEVKQAIEVRQNILWRQFC